MSTRQPYFVCLDICWKTGEEKEETKKNPKNGNRRNPMSREVRHQSANFTWTWSNALRPHDEKGNCRFKEERDRLKIIDV